MAVYKLIKIIPDENCAP